MTKEIILDKLEKVVNKLKNLDNPKIDKDNLKKEDFAKGIIKRDFGIDEWDWPQGVGIFGLNQLQKLYPDRFDNNNFLFNWYKKNIEIGLPSRNINTTVPLLTLLDISDIYPNEGFDKLCLEWVNNIMENFPRTKEGGIQHVTTSLTDRNGISLNEGHIWIDTLFMLNLFLNKIGVKYNNIKWIDESIYQVLIHIKYLYDKKTHLFHHGWNFLENHNFGEVFWCRGNSWFTLMSMYFIENSGKYLNDSIKDFIIYSYKAQVNSLIELQDKSGGWHTILDDTDSYLETSGSASIVAGIFKGMYDNVLDKSYEEYAFKGLEFLLNNINDDGIVLNVSGGTNIGMNKEHYKNIIIAPMAYGQSLTILALVEALKYMK